MWNGSKHKCVGAGRQGHVADPLGRIGADQADSGGPFRTEQIEEPLQGGPVMAGGGPHQPAGVVVDDDHQVLVAAPVGDLVDPDASEPVEGVDGGSRVGHDPGSDRAHGPPRDPHQRDHRGLGGVGHQPCGLVIEGPGVPGAVTRPRHRRHDHPMIPAPHAWGVRLDEHLHRPGIQRPPPAPALAAVVTARPAPTVAAPAGRVRPGTARHHDLAHRLVGLDTLDHHAAVDADDPRPYPLRLHAVALALADQPRTVGKPARATACSAPAVRSHPRIRQESPNSSTVS
jgi:hypothetical protein